MGSAAMRGETRRTVVMGEAAAAAALTAGCGGSGAAAKDPIHKILLAQWPLVEFRFGPAPLAMRPDAAADPEGETLAEPDGARLTEALRERPRYELKTQYA